MNKTILTITAAVTFLFASCGNNSKNAETTTSDSTTVTTQEALAEPEAEASIAGTWKMTAFDVDMKVPKGKEQALEDMKKKMIAETVYTFNEDGTMSFKNPMVKETPGTYTYEDSKIIITNNATKKSETVTVEELTADKLVIVSEQGANKATMTFSNK